MAAVVAVNEETLWEPESIDSRCDYTIDSQPEKIESSMVDSRAGWVVVLGSFFVHFVVFGTQLSFGVFYEHYLNQAFRSSSSFSLGFIGALSSAFTTIFGLFSGSCADRYGYKITMISGNVVIALGLLLASFSTQVWQLYLTQGVLFGIGSSFVFFPALSAPNTWFSKHRGIAMGVAVSGSGIGGLCIAPLTRFIIDQLGFQWALRILCLINVVVVSLAILVTRPLVRRHTSSFWDFEILRDWRFLAMLYTGFIASAGYLVPFYLISSTLQLLTVDYAVSIGISPQQGALLVGIINGASAIGRITFGKFSDVSGHINTFAFCIMIAGLSCLFIWLFAGSFGMLVVFAVVNGSVAGGYISLFSVAAAELFGTFFWLTVGTEKLATYIGMLIASAGIGNLVGVPIASALRESSGTYNTAVIFTGMMLLLGSLGPWYIRFRTMPKLMAKF